MILLDMQQVMIANMTRQLGTHQNTELNIELLRHMVLNTVRLINKTHAPQFGELIIACEGGYNWRKEFFPYYKIERSRNRNSSEINWRVIFDSFDLIQEEIKQNFPYRVVKVYKAEADDVIGVLSSYASTELHLPKEKVLIISGDKDFKQLGDIATQYDHIKKRLMNCADPKIFLREHIIRGDRSDSIPNVLSSNNTYASEVKIPQKKITQNVINNFLQAENPLDVCENDEIRANWIRNETLIDLSKSPTEIKKQILEEYNKEANKDRTKLMQYFIDKNLKRLHDKIGEF